jgi:hypothetical protein
MTFETDSKEIKHVKLKDGKAPPQAPFYVQKEKLLTSTTIDETLS